MQLYQLNLLSILLVVSSVYGFSLKNSLNPLSNKIRSNSMQMTSSLNFRQIRKFIGFSSIALGCLCLELNPNSVQAIGEATTYKLPPIDFKDPDRCELKSSTIGQANAARNKLYDLRQCDLKGQTGAGKDMSGAIFSEADFSGVNFKEAQISKAYARNSKFVNCDFTDGIVDRVSFDGSNLKGAIFKNAVLSGTTFTDADLTDTDFTDSYIGPYDLKNLCLNPTLKGTNPVTKADTFESAGCQ